MNRRKFYFALAISAVAASFGTPAAAAWPDRPLRLVVGYSGGTPPDLLARIFADHLTARTGQPVVVENRTGVSSLLAADYVARQPADGYTLMMATTSLTAAPSLMKKPPAEPSQFAAVGQISNIVMGLVVTEKLKVNTVAEFVAKLKAAPGKYNYGSYGPTSAGNLATVSLNQMLGISAVHTPYKLGAQLVTDLVNGDVQYILDPVQFALPQAKAGKTRILAVATTRRVPQLPDVPTLAESGAPRYAFEPWWGVVVRAGTPPEIIGRINGEIKAMLDDPSRVRQIEDLFMTTQYSSPQAFGELMQRSVREFAEQARAAGIEPE